MADTVEVVTSGTVDRDDRCVYCGKPMLYRVNGGGYVVASFCGSISDNCPAALMEIAEEPK